MKRYTYIFYPFFILILFSCTSRTEKEIKQDFKKYLYLEDFKRAEKILIEDLAREDSAELYYLYGLLNSKRNEDIKALQYFDSTIFIDSLHYKAYIEKASLYAKNKRYSVALKLLDSAELIYPEFDGIYVNRGKVYAEMNQPYLMLKQFEKAIKIDSTNSVTLSNFGTYYLEKHHFDTAAQYFRKALIYAEQEENIGLRNYITSEIFSNLGMVKFIKDENDSAKHYFKKARQRNHKNFNSHYFLGQIEIYDEKYAQALEHFDKARTIDPDHAPVLYFSSLAKYYLRRFEDALTDINKAIELRKGYADAYGIRGNIHLMMGNKNKGCEDYQKSFDLGNKQYKEAIKETCN